MKYHTIYLDRRRLRNKRSTLVWEASIADEVGAISTHTDREQCVVDARHYVENILQHKVNQIVRIA